MKLNWKHLGALFLSVILPAGIAVLAGHPITAALALQALVAMGTTAVALFLPSPSTPPEVK